MGKATVSAQNVIRLLSGLLAVGIICCFIIVSPVSTPLAAGLIAITLLLVLALVFTNSRAHKAPKGFDDQTHSSDPIFVNETWILKR